MYDPRGNLSKANRVRTQRKELREEVIAGSQKLSDILRDPPEYLGTEKVGTVLEWLPGIGPSRARVLALTTLNLAPGTRLRNLWNYQRQWLVQQVEELESKGK